MKQIFLLLSFLLFAPLILIGQIPNILPGQIPSPDQISKELDDRGYDEIEIRRRLADRGIDLNTIDPTNPIEVNKVNEALQEIKAELDKEKADNKTNEKKSNDGIQRDEPTVVPADNPNQAVEDNLQEEANEKAEDIKEAVEDGATIEEAVSEELTDELELELPEAKTWGQQVFRDKSIRVFRQSEDIKPPDSYILGVGDFVTVSIWGYSQENIVFEINKEGYIKPEKMERITLKGITLGQAKKLLEKRFSQYYRFRPEEFALTLNFSRTITVNMVGEVFNQGSYTIPAINTAFNALVAAGGPTDIGSVRKIKLMRAGSESKNIDIYKYLLNPSTQEKLFLEENDFIQVPIAERIVEVQGAVNRPHRYELIDGENLIQLIEYAGGLTDDALRGNIQIKRIEDDKEIIIDANLNELRRTNQDFVLKKSDIVTINTINKGVDNFVDITGAVEFPSRYAFTDNLRISDLIKKAVIKEEAMKDVAFLQRTNIDGTVEYVKVELGKILESPNSQKNLVLKPKDKLIIYSLDKFADKRTIEIKGNVRTPGLFPYDIDDSLYVSDLILLGDGLNPNAAQFGYIKRFDISNKEVKDYIKVDLFSAKSGDNSAANIKLEPFDELTVFEKESYTDENTVSVSGAVRDPDTYDFTNGMRVSDLVYLSSGLNPDATPFAYLRRESPTREKQIEYIRVDLETAVDNPGGLRDLLLKPGDELTTYSRVLFRDSISVTIGGAVRVPGEYPYDESLQIKDIITMAGGLTINAAKNKIDVNRIEFSENSPTKTVTRTIEVDKEFDLVGNPNFTIEPFDQIVVRKVPDFEFQRNVTITGEVFYPGVYAILNEDEPLSSLVERAGGVTEFGFPEGATLRRFEDSTGFVIIELDKALKNKGSKNNVILKARDELFIPKKQDLVTISGDIRTRDLYKSEILEGNKINVPYDGGKRALYYIRNHGGGIGESGSRKNITVQYPNGETKRTRNYFLFSVSPKVRPGSKINVGPKKIEKEDDFEAGKEKVDWENVFSKTITQVTSVLTLILLLERIGG